MYGTECLQNNSSAQADEYSQMNTYYMWVLFQNDCIAQYEWTFSERILSTCGCLCSNSSHSWILNKQQSLSHLFLLFVFVQGATPCKRHNKKENTKDATGWKRHKGCKRTETKSQLQSGIAFPNKKTNQSETENQLSLIIVQEDEKDLKGDCVSPPLWSELEF